MLFMFLDCRYFIFSGLYYSDVRHSQLLVKLNFDGLAADFLNYCFLR